ncbi:MAG TPA: sulfate ABC transporter substrate-binding protein, partial [Desulfobacteria bacterium]|nr:sulfate ABC transporter substrate-binding protein [Desulfobacteria bacterium]
LKELTGKQLDQQVLDNAFSRLVFTTNPEVQAIDKFAGLIRQAVYLKEKPAIDQLVSPELLNKILAEQGLPKSN